MTSINISKRKKGGQISQYKVKVRIEEDEIEDCNQRPDYRAPCVLTTEFGLCLKDSKESLKYNQRGKTIMF